MAYGIGKLVTTSDICQKVIDTISDIHCTSCRRGGTLPRCRRRLRRCCRSSWSRRRRRCSTCCPCRRGRPSALKIFFTMNTIFRLWIVFKNFEPKFLTFSHFRPAISINICQELRQSHGDKMKADTDVTELMFKLWANLWEIWDKTRVSDALSL